jgi:hypothetical protein
LSDLKCERLLCDAFDGAVAVLRRDDVDVEPERLTEGDVMKDSERKVDVETHQVAGHSVEIRRVENREELRIDGVRTGFFVTEDGYNLDHAAYARPQKSLLDAVKTYLQPKKPKPESR